MARERNDHAYNTSTMSNPIGICLIGAGAIAERHMRAYEQLGGVLRKWVVSRPEEAARDFAQRWKFAHFGTSIEPALADQGVQLVLITSPSPLHSEQAVQAMQAGKDVIVEIPVGLSWPEAQRVAEAAATLQRRVWVCHTLRSTAALREVRDQVRSGRLHLTHISGFFGIPRRRNQGGRHWHTHLDRQFAVASRLPSGRCLPVGPRNAGRSARASALWPGPSNSWNGAGRWHPNGDRGRRANYSVVEL